MISRRILFDRAKTVVAILALLSLLFLRVRSPETLLGDELLDLGHLPLFGLIAYLLLLTIQRKPRWGNKALAASFVGAISLAIVSELGQTYAQRNASLADFLHNVLGALLVLGGVYVYQRRKRILAACYGVVALAVLWYVLSPVAQLVVATPKYRDAFPQLGSFEHSWELAYWRPHCRSRVERSQTVSSEGAWSLRVLCPPRSYPGTRVSDFPKDWSAYRALRFDVYVPGPDTLRLYLQVDSTGQREPEQYGPSWEYAVTPGWNTKELSIDVLARDLGRPAQSIRSCTFFLSRPERATTFYLDNIALSEQ